MIDIRAEVLKKKVQPPQSSSGTTIQQRRSSAQTANNTKYEISFQKDLPRIDLGPLTAKEAQFKLKSIKLNDESTLNSVVEEAIRNTQI